jgi:hypothetical protein
VRHGEHGGDQLGEAVAGRRLKVEAVMLFDSQGGGNRPALGRHAVALELLAVGEEESHRRGRG